MSDGITKQYRMVHRKHKNGSESYGIHEIYYDSKGKIIIWSHTPVAVSGKDWLECCLKTYEMEGAFYTPVMEWDDLMREMGG